MLKKCMPLVMILFVLVTLTSCEEETQQQDIVQVEESELSSEIQEMLNVSLEKRVATETEIAAYRNALTNRFSGKNSCSLDSDAECSSESTSEFLFYVDNCATYALPEFGGFNMEFKRAAISYYVDGDGDVNCDNYEDDLQNMIDNVIAQVGGFAWDVIPSVYMVTPCN